jgi:hypothetical protein
LITFTKQRKIKFSIRLKPGFSFSFPRKECRVVEPFAKAKQDSFNVTTKIKDDLFVSPSKIKDNLMSYSGRLQGKKQVVGDVLLPPWASSVDDFIRQHRNALGKALAPSSRD